MIFSRLLIASLTFICSASGAFAEPVRVTATIFPIADIVKHIGGDLVDVRILLKPGQDPHSYEASPGTVRAIGKTDVLVTAGFGFERFLDKLLKSSSRKGRVVVDLSKAVGHPIKTGKSRSGKHSSVNPHYWLDPLIMSDVALLIGKALEAKIPLSASVINDRTLKTISKLKELDNEISNILNEPGLGNKYVAFHNAWSYFARRYGLKEIGVIKNAPGKEPSAKHIVSLIEKIKFPE